MKSGTGGRGQKILKHFRIQRPTAGSLFPLRGIENIFLPYSGQNCETSRLRPFDGEEHTKHTRGGPAGHTVSRRRHTAPRAPAAGQDQARTMTDTRRTNDSTRPGIFRKLNRPGPSEAAGQDQSRKPVPPADGPNPGRNLAGNLPNLRRIYAKGTTGHAMSIF